MPFDACLMCVRMAVQGYEKGIHTVLEEYWKGIIMDISSLFDSYEEGISTAFGGYWTGARRVLGGY